MTLQRLADRMVVRSRSVSPRGEVRLHARAFAQIQRGVVISEGIWPNHAFADGKGINTLTGCDQPAPLGGGPFHDNKVWVRPS